MAWSQPGPGRPRTLAPEERLRGAQQKSALYFLRALPAGESLDTRDIATRIYGLSARRELCEWAAKRFGLSDDVVYRILTAALATDGQMQAARRAVDGLEQAGLIVKVGDDGWKAA